MTCIRDNAKDNGVWNGPNCVETAEGARDLLFRPLGIKGSPGRMETKEVFDARCVEVRRRKVTPRGSSKIPVGTR